MIITVTLNPAVDKTLFIPGFSIDEVNRVQEIRMDPGGKGINVSKAVQAFGGNTVCVGVLGGDTGRYIQDTLRFSGLATEMVFVQEPTRTNIKIVDLENKTNTDINEAGTAVEKETLDSLWEKLSALVHEGDIVVIAGKNPPGTPTELLADWTKRLRNMGVRVYLDTVAEPMRLALQQKPFAIKPNCEELCELMHRPLDTQEQIVDAIRELLNQGINLVAVSMGGDGAIFAEGTKMVRAYAPKVSVKSTVGAGDTMMAAMAWMKERDASLENVARWATAAASAAVQIDGSEPAKLEQIQELLPQVRIEQI